MAEISSPGNVECALACLRNETCLSFNFAIVPHPISKLHTCQLLPIDKYWNPDRFASSQQFHHYAIPVGLVSKSPLVVVHFSVWRTKCPKRNKILFDGQIYQVTGKFSVLTKLTFGIPQGQIHGPRLYVLHFNDVPNCSEDTSLWLFYDNTSISAVNKAIEEGEVDLHNDSRMRGYGCRHWIFIHSTLSLNVVKIDYVLTGSDKNYEIPKEPKVVKSKYGLDSKYGFPLLWISAAFIIASK